MLRLHLLALAISLAGASSASDIQASCLYRRRDGVIKEEFRRQKNETAKSKVHCVLASCHCNTRCAASFQASSGLCVVSSDVYDRLSRFQNEAFVRASSEDGWITFEMIVTSCLTTLERPSGLWLFDNEMRGRNLGTKGPQMDCSVDDLVWTEEGPLGSSSALKYPRLPVTAITVYPKIQILHGGEHVIDFSKPFTIALWIKTDVIFQNMLILEGYPQGTMDVHFYPSYTQDQIGLGLRFPHHYFRSIKNSTGRSGWRHIAGVYSVSSFKFYLNGSVWPLEWTAIDGSYAPPNAFCLWYHCNLHQNHLQGSIASLTIYQRALSMLEVVELMQKCP